MNRRLASFALAGFALIYVALDLHIRINLGHVDQDVTTKATIFIAAWLVHVASEPPPR